MRERMVQMGLCAALLFTMAFQGCSGVSNGGSKSSSGGSAPQALALATTSLPSGTLGAAYSVTLQASGGTSPYTWSVATGNLPTSVTVNAASGVVSGTPSQSGSFNVTIQVADSASHTASHAFSLTVAAAGAKLDQYGGRTDISCAGGATGYFYKEKIANRWWLCTPAGNAFFYQGIYGVDYEWVDGNDPQGVNGKTLLSTKYGASAIGGDWLAVWAPATLNRLESWGFNATVNSSSHVWPTDTDSNYTTPDHSVPVKMPFITYVRPGLGSMMNYVITGSTPFLAEPVKGFMYAASPVYNGLVINWRGWQIADWYDPKVASWLQQELANDPSWTPLKSSTYANYLIGISCEDADNAAGFMAGDAFQTNPPNAGNPHLGWLTATMSPLVVGETKPMTAAPEVFNDHTMYTKKAWHDFLVSKYGTIGALNTAWGSSYTTFDSTGTQVSSESLGTGDGSTTTFTKTLAHTVVSPYTIAVRVNGTLVAGDCPSWTSACSAPSQGQAILVGPTSASPAVSTGYVNFTTGALSVTFSTPPTSLATITVDYVYGGWDANGTGLMDEDGRASHQSWIGNDDKSLSNSSSAVAADMNTFLEQMAEQFFGTCATNIKAAFPHTLYLGPDSLFTWNVPSRAPVLTAAGKYIDAMISSASVPFTPAELSYIYQYAGDVPIIEGVYLHSNPDSPFNQYVNGVDPLADYGTQERKGQDVYSFIATDLSATYPNGSYPYIGYSLWSYFDSWAEQKNWGLVTWRDNAYDGHESITGSTTCSAPIAAFACGGEASTPYPTWQPSHSYTAQTNRVIATVSGTTYYLEPETTGTSSASQPNWPTVLNGTVSDGGVTWMNVGPKTNPTGYGDAITKVTQTNALWLQ
jgi:Putative Ig domain